MKLPSSSPSSSTTSASPSSYRLNSDAATAGCLSGILRRLICGTLDMGSSSRSRVADATATDSALGVAGAEKGGNLNPLAAPPVPGIVARLMGLESMPAPPCAPQEPIGRSRSTSSLEGWPVLLPVHRRSHSFHETPTFLRQENDEFLLLSFCADDGDEKEITKRRPREAKDEMGRREFDEKDDREEETQQKPSKTERAAEKTNKKNKSNVQREVSKEKASERCRRHVGPPPKAEVHVKASLRRAGSSKTTTTHKETPERRRATKGGDKKRSGCSQTTVEPECSSQNSSPVSVLDGLPELDGESLTDTSTPISDAEEEPRPAGSPRRKLSSELDCFNDPSPFFHLILVEEKEGSLSTKGGRVGIRAATSVPHSSSDLWAEAHRLVDGDVQRQPWRTQDSEEVAVEFGLLMLEDLLHEMVGEFCHVPSAASFCTCYLGK